MNLTWSEMDEVTVVRLEGRLDGHGAKEAAAAVPSDLASRRVVLDFAEVSYLSSAGVRLILAWHKATATSGGAVVFAAVQPFCAEVLDMSGLAGVIPVFADVGQAVHELRGHDGPGAAAETCETGAGRFVFHPLGSGHGTIDIMGDIANVLDCAITADRVVGKPFFETEYSLGLGALGAKPEDYLPVMGEAIMVAGTMVWLPTDGNDEPDYMIPRKASTTVVLHTGFNASLRGGFNEFAEFTAPVGKPATIRDIYRALFDLARERRFDYRGIIGLAMRAEIAEAFGAGLRKSPLRSNRPANGLPITDLANYAEWFESDAEPRHRNVTALICGAGEDMTMEMPWPAQGMLRRMFYVDPANQSAQTETLHNHAVFFTGAPPPGGTRDMDVEMRRVVDESEFVDMRHLLDQTTVKSALIAVSYVQEVREDVKKG
jgi:anti-anti-sigma factor